jgi:hypothetical protein
MISPMAACLVLSSNLAVKKASAMLVMLAITMLYLCLFGNLFVSDLALVCACLVTSVAKSVAWQSDTCLVRVQWHAMLVALLANRHRQHNGLILCLSWHI